MSLKLQTRLALDVSYQLRMTYVTVNRRCEKWVVGTSNVGVRVEHTSFLTKRTA